MPVYEFVCDKCGISKEVHRPMSQAGQSLACDCGQTMRRIFSHQIGIFMPMTGRDEVLATLNREKGGYTYPGGEMHSARYDQAMAKGLDPPRQTVGRGFGQGLRR